MTKDPSTPITAKFASFYTLMDRVNMSVELTPLTITFVPIPPSTSGDTPVSPAIIERTLVTDEEFFRETLVDDGRVYEYCTFEGCDLVDVWDKRFEIFAHSCTFYNCIVPGPNLPVRGTAFTAYKVGCDGTLIVLEIPADAEWVCPHQGHRADVWRKMRASKAVVKEVRNQYKAVRSWYEASFVYTEGTEVKPQFNYDPNPDFDCGGGIHFFLTEEEARRYYVEELR